MEVATGGKRGNDKLLGYSVSATLRLLGEKGVKTEHAMAIMQARGIACNKVTVSTLLSDGRSGKYGASAKLTIDQFNELFTSAKDPTA